MFDAFPARERGKALALFFGITGGLTSIGPIAGSFLLPWTWRRSSISVPIAVVALVLTLRTRPDARREPTRIDRRGARRAVIPGVALAAVGFVVWADRLQHGLGQQWVGIVLAGAGLGLVLTTVSTDATSGSSRATSRAPPGRCSWRWRRSWLRRP